MSDRVLSVSVVPPTPLFTLVSSTLTALTHARAPRFLNPFVERLGPYKCIPPHGTRPGPGLDFYCVIKTRVVLAIVDTPNAPPFSHQSRLGPRHTGLVILPSGPDPPSGVLPAPFLTPASGRVERRLFRRSASARRVEHSGLHPGGRIDFVVSRNPVGGLEGIFLVNSLGLPHRTSSLFPSLYTPRKCSRPTEEARGYY